MNKIIIVCIAISASFLFVAPTCAQPGQTSSAYEKVLLSTPNLKWEKDDCEKGYEEAMNYAWGMNHEHLNTQEAVKQLKALAIAECAEAAATLAAVGYQGCWVPVVPKDESSAQELANIALADGLVKRADEGRPNAQYLLALFYIHGLGVAEDMSKAWQLSVKSAKSGCAISQFFLGVCSYDPADGSGKDPSRAAYWYEQAAAQGLAQAQFKLGLMNMKGVGIPEDRKKAVQLIQQAANQGYEQAIAEMSLMN